MANIENKILFNIALIGGVALIALPFVASHSMLRYFDLPAGVMLILPALVLRRRSRRRRHRHKSRMIVE